MVKRLIITLLGLALLIGLPAAIKLQQFRLMAATPMVMPPETVTEAPARREQWPNSVDAVGTLVAVQGVTVSAEVGGKIVSIDFASGARVAAGDRLVQLDTATEQAQLRSAEAAATLARINRDRSRDLLASRTTSKADFDSAEAQFKQAAAQVDNMRATIAKKTVRAPFAGRLGLRQVNLGQIVKEGDPVVDLQTIDPIYVEFSLPQQRFSVLAAGVAVRVTTDAAPGRVFTGTINAVSPQVDATTRSVRVQATIANPGGPLRPGMYASVEVVLPQREAVLAIPATAVLYAPYGDTVFVIEPQEGAKEGAAQGVLRQQIVRLGRTRGDFVAVKKGLKAGDRVVTSGVFKLRPKMKVVVDNTLAPPAKLAPHPRNE
jgi:membrane fusion protein (multidrug efflux system)